MRQRHVLLAGSIALLVVAVGAHPAVASADDEARLDAVIDAFEQRMVDAGWTGDGVEDDDDDSSDDLGDEAVEELSEEDEAMAACFGDLGIPIEGDLEEFPGETARSESDEFSYDPTSGAPVTTELFSFDFTGETISAFAVSVDETGLETLEQFVAVFGSEETGECLRREFEAQMTGGITTDVPAEMDVDVTTSSDLGIGDQSSQFDLALSGDVMGLSFDTTSQLLMSRVGNDLVAIAYVALGGAESGIDPVEELEQLADSL
jgi:hypothetical protein